MEYIFHIADVHICAKTAVNIEHSFGRLIDEIKSAGVSRSMLVIAGDIFEHKHGLTTEEMIMFKKMYKMLTEENIKTLIIPGNHDFKPKTAINFDPAEENAAQEGPAEAPPVIDHVTLLTRRYLDNNGKSVKTFNRTEIIGGEIFGDPDIEFHIFSPIDGKIPEYKDNPRIKIAVLHEPINNSRYDNNTTITNGRFSADDFGKYDFVMLGDIHKPQFLKPNVAYPGSFVQKNKGEDIHHGYILWDVKQKTGKFVPIPLKQVSLRLFARNNTCNVEVPLESFQKVIHINLYYQECGSNYLCELVKEVYDKYMITPNLICRDVSKNNISEGNPLTELNQSLDHSEIIKEMLTNSGKENMIDDILQLHSTELQKINTMGYSNYTINYLFWSNVYCYGPYNYINFTELNNNMILINGNNEEGKSSVIDILTIAIFGNPLRGKKADIIRKGSKEGLIEVSITIGNNIYKIKRLFSKLGISHDSMEFSINGVLQTASSKKEPYTVITNLIGTDNDFTNMAIAQQNRAFISEFNTTEKNGFNGFLIKLLGIDQLKIIADNINSIKKQYNPRDLYKKLNNLPKVSQEDINQAEKILDEYTAHRKSLQDKEETLSEKINYLNKEYDVSISDKNIEDRICILEKDVNANKDKFDSDIFEKIPEYKNKFVILENDIKTVMFSDETASQEYNFDDLNDVDPAELSDEIKQLEIETAAAKQPEELVPAKLTTAELQQIVDNGCPEIPQLVLEACEIPGVVLLDDRAYWEALAAVKPLRENLAAFNPAYKPPAIEKPEFYDRKEEYEVVSREELPDYDFIFRELTSAKHEHKFISEKISSLEFSGSCNFCQKNKNVFNLIDDSYSRKIAEFSEIIDNKEKMIERRNIAKRNLEVIHKYEEYSEYVNFEKMQNELDHYQKIIDQHDYFVRQNEIFIRNREKQNHIDQLREKQARFHQARENILWREQQDKLRRLSELKETQKKLSLKKYFENINEYENIKTILQYIDQVQLLTKLKKNLEIKTELDKLDYDYKKIKTELNEIVDKIIQQEKKVDKLHIQFYEYNKLRDEISFAEDRYNFYQTYLSCIDSKNGLPHIIISNMCTLWQDEINNILSQIATFTINLVLKNDKILVYINKGQYQVVADMASGYQRFIIDLVMRMTLMQLTNISNPNMLFVDEGFGSLDNENFIQVCNMLSKFKEKFKAIFIITHNNELKSYADKAVTIKRINNTSKIVFGSDENIPKYTKFVNMEKFYIEDEQPSSPPEDESSGVNIDELIYEKNEKGEYNYCKVCDKVVNLSKASRRSAHRVGQKHKAKEHIFLQNL